MKVKIQEIKFETLERDYLEVEKQLEFLIEYKELLRKQIIEYFEEKYGHVGAKEGRLQRIIQERLSFDDEMMALILRDKFDKIKKEVVDREKFIAALKTGLIPEEAFAAVERKEVDIIKTL